VSNTEFEEIAAIHFYTDRPPGHFQFELFDWRGLFASQKGLTTSPHSREC